MNKHFQVKPNSHTCPVCLGLPGALPFPNKKAIEWTLLIGKALNCRISQKSKFDRKHYFYPDLPKGYQISQYDEPFCTEGNLKTSQGDVRITRVHLEEDTGKLVHKKLNGQKVSLVDFNRSGVPLVEIVTEPDIHSASQAKEFAKSLRQIIRYLEVSDCDMEKGSMRLEANISWGLDLGYKVEIKNLNSFRFVEKAIDFELKRQKKLLDQGITPRQETRGWSEGKGETIQQRYKETAADYRYFPEPDIPPLRFTKEFIQNLDKKLPELPQKKAKRFIEKFKIREHYAQMLVAESKLADFSEEAFENAIKEGIEPGIVASAIVNQKILPSHTTPQKLINKLKSQLKSKVSDITQLENWATKAINDLPDATNDYQKGKTQAISALIGKVMQLSKGKAEAKKVKKILEIKLQ